MNLKMKMWQLVEIVALCLALATVVCMACELDTATLRAARLEAAARWVSRTNFDFEYYNRTSYELLLPEGKFCLDRIGCFETVRVAVEYGNVLFLGVLGQPPPVKLVNGEILPFTVEWLTDDVLGYKFYPSTNCQDPNPAAPNGFDRCAFNLIISEFLEFEPCGTRLRAAFVVNDPEATRVNEGNTALAEDICISQFLPPPISELSICPPPFQQFTDFGSCVAYYLQNASPYVDSPCNIAPFVTRNMLCYALHLNNAAFFPDLHCPHVGPNSHPCNNEVCLESCSNCGLNAHCELQIQNYNLETFACVCDAGYTQTASVNGTLTCEPATCSRERDCPADRKLATCENGLCGCQPSISWITTTEARDANAACACAAGEYLRRDGELRECLPNGRCRQDRDCIQGDKAFCFDSDANNTFPSYDLCVCNYGYTGILDYDCECPAPAREIRNAGRMFCLKPTECFRNRDCAVANGGVGGRCRYAAVDDLIGMCQ